MNGIDRFVLVEYDARNGDPTSEENAITSPNLIRGMCAELMAHTPILTRLEAVISAKAHMLVYCMDASPTIDSDIDKMAWGDWLEVGRDRQDSDQRLYLVKVIDQETTEIDRKWVEGKGGGW